MHARTYARTLSLVVPLGKDVLEALYVYILLCDQLFIQQPPYKAAADPPSSSFPIHIVACTHILYIYIYIRTYMCMYIYTWGMKRPSWSYTSWSEPCLPRWTLREKTRRKGSGSQPGEETRLDGWVLVIEDRR